MEEKIETKLLQVKRVAHTRAGGKKIRFRATVVVGNRAGKVGVGVASGMDVAQAIEKATYQAKKNMIEVPIVNETIPHEIFIKFKTVKLLLKPQRRGRGLVAGGTVRTVCSLAGITNISAKNLGRTTNRMNVALATFFALKKLKKPKNASSSIETKI